MLKIVAAALLVALGQESGREKHPWAKWTVGTTVTFTIAMESGGQKQEGQLRTTLSEKGEKGYKVKEIFEIAGNRQEREDEEEYPTREGEETLTIEGKEYKCTIWKAKGKRGDKETEARYWLAPGQDVPLKMTAKEGGESHGTLTAVRLKEGVTAGGRKYDCVRFEGALNSAGRSLKATAWLSPEVPGFFVKTTLQGEGGVKMDFQVAEVDARK